VFIQIGVTNRVEDQFKNPITNRVPDPTTNRTQNLIQGLHIIGLTPNLTQGLLIQGQIQDRVLNQAQGLAADLLLQDQVQGHLQIEDLLRGRAIIEQDINKYLNYINYGHE